MANARWLLVGAGEIANTRVARALTDAEQSEIAAICDLDRERAEELAERFSVRRVYDSFETALAESGADAVYLAVPVKFHAAMGIRSLEAGKHLLVEKPLALNGAEARKLVDAVNASDKVSGCAFFRRFSGQYQFTKTALAKNEIGRVVGGGANYILHLPAKHVAEDRWFLHREIAGGGLLCHLGSHVFDIVVGLLGMPEAVTACCGTMRESLKVEDWASVILRLPGSAPFSFNLNWNSDAPCRHDFEVLGSGGRITWPEWPPHGDAPVVVRRGREMREEVVPNCNDNWHLPLVQNFVDAICGGGRPICPIPEAAKTNVILDAVYRSAVDGREVVIAPADPESCGEDARK